jgi:SPOR domain
MRQPLDDYEERSDEFELLGDERTDDYRRPERRFPAMLVSILAMAVFAGGLWFAYYEGTRQVGGGAPGGGVPLLRADRQPDKVRPEQPGGMKIPNQDASIYNEKPGGPAIEKLLPPPEKPLPRPAPPPAPPPPPRQAMASPPPPPAIPAGAPPSAEAMPKAVPLPARPELRPAVTAAGLQPEHAARGRLQVRLGSLRSPEAARREWQRLRRDNPDLLGRLHAVAVRTDLGEKGIYYRIEAGPLADAAAAERLCSELRHRKFGCILAR